MSAARPPPLHSTWRLQTVVRNALVAAAFAVVLGCATLAQPTPVDAAWAAARWPDASEDELRRGRALYVKRCAGCHAVRLPERYPSSTWEQHVDEMATRAELPAAERELMLRYLLTMSRHGRLAEVALANP